MELKHESVGLGAQHESVGLGAQHESLGLGAQHESVVWPPSIFPQIEALFFDSGIPVTETNYLPISVWELCIQEERRKNEIQHRNKTGQNQKKKREKVAYIL